MTHPTVVNEIMWAAWYGTIETVICLPLILWIRRRVVR